MKRSAALLILALCLSASSPLALFALTPTEELQQKIDDQSAKIKQIDAEIAQYEKELTTIGANKSSLNNEIKKLDTLRKKYSADIQKSNREIERANLKITELSGAISEREKRIKLGEEGLSRTLRLIEYSRDQTLIETSLSPNGFAMLWEELDRANSLSSALQSSVQTLSNERKELAGARDQANNQKVTLTALTNNLQVQKSVLDQNRVEQNTLLTQTKNKESEYQKLLAAKKLAKQQFEAELQNYESQLKFIFDPSSIPTAGTGVLALPFSNEAIQRCATREKVFGNLFCITQFFGNTDFAKSGAYNGKGHNGVDFGITDGTQIYPAKSGSVVATGNTDAYPGCYSYGKWVLVDHGDGLTSLYAHLSYIGVTKGQDVSRNTLLGYSGHTGYATGPHLHFTLYVSSSVQLVKLGSVKAKTNCAGATVPVAATGAYLNPMAYF